MRDEKKKEIFPQKIFQLKNFSSVCAAFSSRFNLNLLKISYKRAVPIIYEFQRLKKKNK